MSGSWPGANVTQTAWPHSEEQKPAQHGLSSSNSCLDDSSLFQVEKVETTELKCFANLQQTISGEKWKWNQTTMQEHLWKHEHIVIPGVNAMTHHPDNDSRHSCHVNSRSENGVKMSHLNFCSLLDCENFPWASNVCFISFYFNLLTYVFKIGTVNTDEHWHVNMSD